MHISYETMRNVDKISESQMKVAGIMHDTEEYDEIRLDVDSDEVYLEKERGLGRLKSETIKNIYDEGILFDIEFHTEVSFSIVPK